MENISMDNQSVICYLTAVVRWDCSLGKVYIEQFHSGKKANYVGSVLEQNKMLETPLLCHHPH